MELHVTPAYGRDYKSKSAVLADWNNGKDFVDSRSGRYLSSRDRFYGFQVWIRYDKLRKLVRAQ